MTIWRMRIACWIPKATHTICNTHCFSTTAVVAGTRLNVSYTYIACLVFLQVISVVIAQWLMVRCFWVWSSVSWVYCLQNLVHSPLSLSNLYTPKCLRMFTPILGAFAKLQKATLIFVVPFLPHATTRIPLDRFSWNLIFEYRSKIWQENSSYVIMWQG